MAETSTSKPKGTPGLKARVFGAYAPKVGVLCLAEIDTGKRPFLPVELTDTAVWGWLFPAVPADDASTDLRVRGISAAGRRAPCYCCVARTALSAV